MSSIQGEISRLGTRVVIDVRRHPDKHGDAITALGERQIRTVARRDHAGISYHFFGFSGARRTLQSLIAVLEELGENRIEPVIVPGVHFTPVEKMVELDSASFWGPAEARIHARCAEENREETIGDWRRENPEYFLAARAAMETTLTNIACMLASGAPAGKTRRALLLSHSPQAEAAVRDDDFPRLPVSAGVRYTLVVKSGVAEILGEEYLLPADESCTTAARPPAKK